MSDSTRPGAAPAPAGGSSAEALPGKGRKLTMPFRSLLAAITLLTILPVPARAQRSIGAREVAASAPWFPVVGAVLGLAIGTVGWAAADRSPALAGALVAALLALVTGALHLDGLADSADALGARGGSRERRLEIMRDSSTGAYGTVAIVAWFGLVATAVAAIDPDTLPVTLALVLALARAHAVGHAHGVPPAREGGLGAGFQPSGAGLAALVVVLLLLLAGAFALDARAGAPLLLPEEGVLIALALGAVLARGLVDLLARRLIGGRTGDTLGAVIALGEVAGLVAVVLLS